MAKKVFTDESLETFVDEIKAHVSEEVSGKANTSHTHSISDITNLQTKLDEKSDLNHTHSSIKTVGDQRSVATIPNDYVNNIIFQGLKNNSTITAPSSNSGVYSYIVGLRGWSDSSGGDSHELAFNNDGLFLRDGSTTSWGDWRRVYDSLHKPTLSELGAAASSHTHSYAGSSSAGGAATSANKLNTNAGDSNTPVYFSNGIPVACTSLDLSTSGNAATATKLQTARTISLGTGATGTATSFNGSANITIPVTDVKESYLSWGGKNLSGSVSPIGAALSTEHSANRLAYLNPDAVTVEYSNDAGSTWTDSGLADYVKINFVTTSNAISVGSDSTVTTSHRTRITFTAQNGTTGYVYTRPRKMLINVSSAGHGISVTIEVKTGVSGASWTTLGTYALTGWSGWNDIPINISTFGGGTSQTSNYWYMRLTFANTSVSSSYTTTKSSIIGLRLFGDTCWTRTSNMGETGHLYSYDYSQNATFPANVTATTFNGTTFSGSGVATVSEVKTYLGIE